MLVWWWVGAVMVAVIGGASGGEVTYDGRSLIISGQRQILFSGSIHYPRSTPDMWPSLISRAKEGGLNVIQTYVFWNIHEPQPGQYDFTGRNDLIGFIKEIQAQGLYASLRIGPFVESEWTYGGLPFWLHNVPDIVFRSNNEPFKVYMQNFTTKIVNMMKSEGLYASQGGPIILSQIENEYQNVERGFGVDGPPYVIWAANMSVGLQTGVPWMMCKQDDAPDPVVQYIDVTVVKLKLLSSSSTWSKINTEISAPKIGDSPRKIFLPLINACNGMICGETEFKPNSPNKPSVWTENWTAPYQIYGNNTRTRSPEDIAYHVALFVAKKNGSFVNYYMYHGGTNFGRTASAYVPTSYYDQAPLDEYGLINQPKWGHLKDLHAAIKLSSEPLLFGSPTTTSLGEQQQAYIFQEQSGQCAAFLVNSDTHKDIAVMFQNTSYELPRKSISILPDCKNEAFNTAKVNAESNTRSITQVLKLDSAGIWEQFREGIPSFDDTTMSTNTLLDQMNTTQDTSDYLWYTFRYQSDISDNQAVLSVNSSAHVLHAFVNGEFVALWPKESICKDIETMKPPQVHDFLREINTVPARSAHGTKYTSLNLESIISISSGTNNISLLSVISGLPDSGAHLEKRSAGLYGVIVASEEDAQYFNDYPWGYKVGLLGEKLQIYTDDQSIKVEWTSISSSAQPLAWYKTTFDAPEGSDPVVLELGSMGKGEVWINGQSIGRYWISFHTPAGTPIQTWFHVPRSFLKPTGNLLVLFDEEYGNPQDISVGTVSRGVSTKEKMSNYSATIRKFWR